MQATTTSHLHNNVNRPFQSTDLKRFFFGALLRADFANPLGFTLDAYGETIKPTTGYAVSYLSLGSFDTRGISPAKCREVFRYAAEWYAANLFSEGQPVYVGAWTDNETGIRYVDALIIVNDLQQAVTIGQRFNQLAVWDFANNVEVRL